jgi:phosphate uptake regulator
MKYCLHIITNRVPNGVLCVLPVGHNGEHRETLSELEPLSDLAESLLEAMQAGVDPTPQLMREVEKRDCKIEELQTMLLRCVVELRKGPQTVESSQGSPLTDIPQLIREIDAELKLADDEERSAVPRRVAGDI